MRRSGVLLAIFIASFAPWTGGARAARPMVPGTEYGTMVSQVVRTLGGTFVDCGGLLGASAPDAAQVACARLPSDMFGYFKWGVHGRLYEYLDRGTLRIAHAWHSVGNVLEASYGLPDGTLKAERKRVNGALYGVFVFTPNAGYASSGTPGP